ncbi:MAG TPA: HD domain-containing protein [Vicinamibacterales bacterium]|nr:HD domain-containing protein [Vicinamibacterales bacterium]
MDLEQQARRIATAVQHAGGRALCVGGFVRDRLLKRASKDLDIEVFGIPQGQLEPLLKSLGKAVPAGQAFPVYKLGDIDIALPRRESKTGRGHKGFTVAGDPSMSFEEAARRRDFTINAVGWDPLTDEYLDPFGGRKDLDLRVLRVVDRNTFADDSLRVLRALQFAARFELTVDPGTARICSSIALDDLPAERIWGEFEKLLLQAQRPSIGFALARELGVIHQLLPEMEALYDCPQDAEWHPEGNVWIHTLMVIDKARELNGELDRPRLAAIMLGAVCHDLGKPITTAMIDGRIKSPNHEAMGVDPSTRILDRFNINTLDGFDVRAQVIGLVAEHLRPMAFFKARDTVTDGAFRRLAQKVDLELLARFARSDCHGRTGTFDCSGIDWFIERARSLGVEHKPPAPLLLGRHLIELGVAPGPGMGELLRTIYELQLDGIVATLDEARLRATDFLQKKERKEGH